MMITEKKDGIELKVKVIPSSSKSGIDSIFNNMIKIKLNAPPEKGKANEELIKVLSKLLKIKKANVEILRGQTTKEKVVFIRNIKKEFCLKKIKEEINE